MWSNNLQKEVTNSENVTDWLSLSGTSYIRGVEVVDKFGISNKSKKLIKVVSQLVFVHINIICSIYNEYAASHMSAGELFTQSIITLVRCYCISIILP